MQLSLIASLPLFLLVVWLMIYADISIYLILLTILLSSISLIYCHSQIHKRTTYQFRSLSNLLDAMIHGDYTLRAYTSDDDIALKELVLSINALAERLNKQRIEAIESQLLLQTVIEHIDVAIIALNNDNRMVFSNPAAEQLLQTSQNNAERNDSLSRLLQQEDFSQLMCGQNQVYSLNLSGKQGKFNIHLEEFRNKGQQQKLLFITDVSTMLRSEEQNAWQNLVRVLSHEINNSLSPIASLSQTLKRFLTHNDDVQSHKDNLLEGLAIIAQRSNNLKSFVNSYKQLAKLPMPQKENTSIMVLTKKVASLFQTNQLTIFLAKDVQLFIDPVQIEQVLINLVKNAVESIQSASLIENADSQKTKDIKLSWQISNKYLQLTVVDSGIGITNSDNLFTPFYTTKKQGSGIGLVLCRQILDAHNGQLHLANRKDDKGCIVTVELPLN